MINQVATQLKNGKEVDLAKLNANGAMPPRDVKSPKASKRDNSYSYQGQSGSAATASNKRDAGKISSRQRAEDSSIKLPPIGRSAIQDSLALDTNKINSSVDYGIKARRPPPSNRAINGGHLRESSSNAPIMKQLQQNRSESQLSRKMPS